MTLRIQSLKSAHSEHKQLEKIVLQMISDLNFNSPSVPDSMNGGGRRLHEGAEFIEKHERLYLSLLANLRRKLIQSL